MENWYKLLRENKNLGSSSKLIGYTLGTYYRLNKETFPSVLTLVEKSCLSRNTVLKSIKELEKANLIHVVSKIREGKNMKQNHYNFIGATIAPLPQEKKSIGATIAPEYINIIKRKKTNNKLLVKETKDFIRPNTKLFGKNVYLKTAEHERLVKDFGKQIVDLALEILDNYLIDGKAAKKYKNHNLVMRKWVINEAAKRLNSSCNGNKISRMSDILEAYK